MTEQTGETGPKEFSVRYLFDQILAKHMERLIGSKYGIDELPLNLMTISSLILLAEREKAIENSPSSAPEQYNRETFLNELSEMGLEGGEEMERALEELIQKNYIDENAPYRFKVKKPTLSMFALLDRAFPDLPGLNLVAYFTQIIDEIQSDRKDIQLGIAQFDRMFLQQGVPLKKQRGRIQQKKEPKPIYGKAVMFSAPTATQTGDLSSVIKSGLKVSTLYQASQAQDDENTDPASSPVSEFQDSDGEDGLPGPDDEGPGDRPFDPGNVEEGAPVEEMGLGAHIGETADIPDDEESPGYQGIDSSGPEIKDLEDPGPGTPTGIEREEDPGVLTDDFIENQISDFEGRLSMVCPLCSAGKILEAETAKGKTYFHCSSGNCNFISWGQPYHIECPLCKNSFLIEKAHKTGKPILKCPRATCRYWQDIPQEGEETIKDSTQATTQDALKSSAETKKPLRKVRRRRVLRRKR